MKTYRNLFDQIISLENLFAAWEKFKSDKQGKDDVQLFEWQLEQNIFQLHRDLKARRYKHGLYTSFWIQDPKQRHIHKAAVRDRVLHHAIFAIINPLFEKSFISNSFSCRINKGTHKGIITLRDLTRKVSGNVRKPCFALKCDIKKFFETIDHYILFNILAKKIKDPDTMWLLREVIESFSSRYSNLFEQKGVPIGNLTSQLFANVYLNEFDQFIKHGLKIKHYLRYTDDFVILADNPYYLEKIISPIKSFLRQRLCLELHPNKVSIRKLRQGIDFLGYVVLPYHLQLRTKTKNRVFKKLKMRVKEYKDGRIPYKTVEQSLQSYLGVLSHADTHILNQELKNQLWFWLNE
ncbi:MAG TPA: reverse transcriptase/maturase family protein [Candidatus Colwellbacteria bacterium]|jgi:retron-type reverse transcriptase|nr:reverse transcriptase/maturase family protein [Candidatus Colwellbacteria bacterium]